MKIYLGAQRDSDVISPFQHARFSARAACEQTGSISGFGGVRTITKKWPVEYVRAPLRGAIWGKILSAAFPYEFLI